MSTSAGWRTPSLPGARPACAAAWRVALSAWIIAAGVLAAGASALTGSNQEAASAGHAVAHRQGHPVRQERPRVPPARRGAPQQQHELLAVELLIDRAERAVAPAA